MDRAKKEVLLEACDLVNTRLDVMVAHLEEKRTATPLEIINSLRGDIDFIKTNISTESITLRRASVLDCGSEVPLSRTPTITRKTLL